MRATETIYREMLVAYAKRRGGQLQEDCDLSVRLWAVAAQIQALEAQAEWVLGQSFPQTAAAGRAAKVAVEGRHVLGIARVAFAKVAIITVCHCVFLRPKCVLLLLRSFYRKRCPINISFSISRPLILPGCPDRVAISSVIQTTKKSGSISS